MLYIADANAQRFFMYENDEVKAEFPARRRSQTVGIVTAVIFHGEDVTMRVGMNALDAKPGDTVNLAVTKQTIVGECIIPIEGLREDYDGKKFVYLVYEQPGAWGKDYIVVKEMVSLLTGADRQHAAINRQNGFSVPVIIGSDQPVYEGMKVRFY